MKAREIAVDILDEILYKGAYSNVVLGQYLNKSQLNSQDRSLVTEIVYGTLKYKYSIDKDIELYLSKNIDTVEKHILNILRISFYQMNYLDKIPEYAIINESVNLAKKLNLGLDKFVNGVLRNHLRKKLKYSPKNELDSLSYKYSFEPWMVRLFLSQYSKERVVEILKGLNKIPPVTLRVNSQKINYEDALELLDNMDYEIFEGKVSPDAIHIRRGSSIENNPLFKEGKVTVQDESAMVVAEILNPGEGEVIFDLCAAPGGKSTHIAELINDNGCVRSFDIYENKLKLIQENVKRLGLKSISVEKMDATITERELIESADKVLIDVPCSGFGIIRKKPEIKWNKNLKDFKTLIDIQQLIIKNAIKYLKVGGTLVYSTCTLNKRENEENVRWLLNNFPGMKIEKIYLGNRDNLIYDDAGYMTILPDEYMDGFFIAKFTKTGR